MMDGAGGINPSVSAMQALKVICDGFVDVSVWLPQCEVMEPGALPPLARKLLAHEQHMTQTLREYYGGELRLDVLDHRQLPTDYARKILLWSNGGGNEKVVEFGIVRMTLSSIGDQAADEIVSRQLPLGDILRTHGILTRVRPHWFVRIPKDSEVSQYFAAPAVFGRLATIEVQRCPTVSLFEAIGVETGNRA